MSYYEDLWNELNNDPLGRGYSGMTDQQAADDLNTVYRTRLRDTLDSAEIYEALDIAEFQGLSDAQKAYVRDVLGLGPDVQVGPNTKARTLFISLFGAQSQTITNLVASATEDISRATELGFPTVKPGHVTDARLLGA